MRSLVKALQASPHNNTRNPRTSDFFPAKFNQKAVNEPTHNFRYDRISSI